MIMLNKIATLIFWVLVVLAWAFDWPGVLGWLPECGVAVAAVHVLEVVYFWFAFRQRSTAVLNDVALIMVFGIFHLRRFIDGEVQQS
ncbi:DUF1145 domain-containing protein [Thalassolituus marinus]|uniref:DUF1145 domain-containing protein n=1 Tax=Thalassolituus marinus TaxID=671053 RepID=A0ABS7ZPN2_9GAMM|nr:DUF1145 domain-containing protein [Thalassolituus marinus]MCA6063689.1 DUF1145 domain-containing protein [Thalassolituus marinus]